MFTHRVIFDQEYDPHTNRHRFPKFFFQNGTERRKARQIFYDVRVYLLVDESVTIVYIRV
jgi:hypothetical protein